MIASWRGLAVAAAIAIVLAIAVVVDGGHTPAVTDRALVPAFDPGRVTELIWERTGQAPVHVVHAADGWETRMPSRAAPDAGSSVPADPSAIAHVLAALRGARWHRRGEPTPAHTTLTVVVGAVRHVLGIGEPIAGTEQTWIIDDGRGVLVDRWIARALDLDQLALRIKTPLAGIRRARTIAIDGNAGEHSALQLDGFPRQLVKPAHYAIASDIARELEHALGDITIVRLPDVPGAAHGVTITTTDEDAPPGPRSVVSVVLGGSCPGALELIAVSGTVGDGCVEPTAVAAVDRAIGRLRQPAEAVVERRPVPFDVSRVVLTDAVSLDTTALRVGDRPADQARVAELVAALTAPAEVARAPATVAVQHLVVTGPAGAAITLDLFAEHVLVRHGEPIALRPASGFWNLLVRPSRELRDVTLWLEEPTMITAVRIDDVRYERGAIIGAWTRRPASGPATTPATPATTVETSTLESLVGLLAAPGSLGFVDEQLAIAHRLTLTVTPPSGAPFEHALALGAPRTAGCPVRLDRDAVVLPAAVCAQVAALAR